MSVTPPSHTHDYGTIWKTDANNHWNECDCTEMMNVAPHVDENGDGMGYTGGYLRVHVPGTKEGQIVKARITAVTGSELTGELSPEE